MNLFDYKGDDDVMGWQVDAVLLETVQRLTDAMYQPHLDALISKNEMRDICSRGQLISKSMLLENIRDTVLLRFKHWEEIKCLVVGGWLGFTGAAIQVMDARIRVTSLDIDPHVAPFVEHVVGPGRSSVGDMMACDYSSYDFIVNTSTEHIPDVALWAKKLPPGKIVVCQSNNNRDIEGHISCVDSLEEFRQLLGFKQVLSSSEITFPMYTRFEIIGQT